MSSWKTGRKYLGFLMCLWQQRKKDWNRPEVGKVMVVVKGKKTPIGFQGTVFRVESNLVGLTMNGVMNIRGFYQDAFWAYPDTLVNVEPFPEPPPPVPGSPFSPSLSAS